MQKVQKRKNSSILQGTNFRWVVPQLSPEIWTRKEAYKAELLDRLFGSKTARKGIQYYSIAIESHADGNPHLDLLLIFDKQVRMSYTELDFLCDKHGDLTRYRTLNSAILTYGSKEDTPLMNLRNVQELLAQKDFKKDPYFFLQKKMKEDIFHFNLEEYCAANNLIKDLKGFLTIRSKLKIQQEALANLALRKKRGLRLITPKIIQESLTLKEYQTFCSWSGYCTIVSYINEMITYGSNRPFKSKQLLIVGEPNTGKTSLIRWLSKYVANYEIGVSNWFPRYTSGTYSLLSWNEFTLKIIPYPNMLKLLEGTPMDLEYKGGSTTKKDNPLIIMNSNLTAFDHIKKKFGSFSKLQEFKQALKNFPVRVKELKIPQGHNLFFFQKILEAAGSESSTHSLEVSPINS